MSNDKAQARDQLAVGVTTSLPERAFGTTQWNIKRWTAGQTDAALRELFRLGVPVAIRETGRTRLGQFHTSYAVTPEQFEQLGMTPYEESVFEGNLITNAGWTRLMNLLTNQGATQAMDATHTRVGVGDGTTPAEAYADTDLAAVAGSTHRWFQLVSGAGTLGTRTLAFSATFGTADGNFAWNEMGLDFGTASGNTVTAPLFNHKVGIAQGTKASGQTWTPTATITFS